MCFTCTHPNVLYYMYTPKCALLHVHIQMCCTTCTHPHVLYYMYMYTSKCAVLHVHTHMCCNTPSKNSSCTLVKVQFSQKMLHIRQIKSTGMCEAGECPFHCDTKLVETGTFLKVANEAIELYRASDR